MYQIFATESGASWDTKTLIWQSDQIVNPVTGGLYNPQLALEINKAGELGFTVTPSFPHYDIFKRNKTILTVIQDEEITLFRGPVKEIKTDLFKQKSITANSDLVYLQDSLFEPEDKDVRKLPAERFAQIIEAHNTQMANEPEKKFTVGNFTFSSGIDTKTKYAKSGGYTDTMSKIKSDMDDLNGYLSVRYSSDYSIKYLDYVETLNKDVSHDIKFAVNIEDLTIEDNMDDLFTILIPTGADDLTIEGITDTSDRTVQVKMPDMTTKDLTVQIDGKYLKIPEGIEKYGYIYAAESFTIDSNDKDAAGTANGEGKEGKEGRQEDGTIIVYRVIGQPENAQPTPVDPYKQGWFIKRQNGKYYRTSDRQIVEGRVYYAQYVISTHEEFEVPRPKGYEGVKKIYSILEQ